MVSTNFAPEPELRVFHQDASREFEGAYPGAYTGKLLYDSPYNPNQFEPFTPDEVYQAIHGLQAAMEACAQQGALGIYRSFAKSASLLLVAKDPSGEALAQFEQTILSAYQDYKRFVEFASSAPKPLNVQEVQVALGGRTERNQLGAVTIETEGDSQVAIVPSFQSHLASQPEIQSLLADFADLTRRSFFLASIIKCRDTVQVSNVGELYTAERTIHESLKQAVAQCTNELGQDLDLTENLLAIRSKGWRFIEFINTIQWIEQVTENSRNLIETQELHHPGFSPHILLARNDDIAEDRYVGESPFAPADMEALDTGIYLKLTGKGIESAKMRYDYQWGALNTAYSSRLLHCASDLRREGGRPELHGYKLFAAILSGVPRLDRLTLEGIVDKLHSDDFKRYLSSQKNWFGPRLLPTKPWLAPENATEEFIHLLTRSTHVLREGGTSGITPDEVLSLQGIMAENLVQDTGAGKLLFEFIKRSITNGIPLAEVVETTFQDKPLVEWFKRWKGYDSDPVRVRIFRQYDDGSVGLTKEGVRYLTDLVDPMHPQHERWDNDREMHDEKVKERFRRRL